MKLFTIHGWSFEPSVWEGTHFESAEHIILPGHGESFFSSSDIVELAREIGEYLPENSALVGWSLGATLAVVMASLYPDKVKELILFAPTVRFSGISQPEVVVKRFLRKLKKDFKRTVKEFRALCSKVNLPLPELDEGKVTELLESFSYFDLSNFARNLSVPAKIFVGEKDSVTGVQGALKLHLLIRSSTLSVFPEEDHLTILRRY
ncbi:alpha/beta fold hydrolase [Phorcysia thermohydrogeniphila]|uniref:Pimeloyl-[acyl-carrier protein] methyl ester esterase n=1 Tax=Phorcysia thermohydrogeniphila TaxID=936138 RepID=A0A4R1GID2_9BACT|nr:alpha/beta fold hydrolase [Phorcysia thermohydrogeniphila]TCK04002.1 pimeloyl-[acyl-carrier protein] methyl ester esterase [Phorcysia thermohydrogeniphila]